LDGGEEELKKTIESMQESIQAQLGLENILLDLSY
jgi:hypothetical protein